MDQVKDVSYGRSILENLKDAVMKESDSLQFINLFPIGATQRDVVTQTLFVRIPHVLIVK